MRRIPVRLGSMYGVADSGDAGSCLVPTCQQLKQLWRRATRTIPSRIPIALRPRDSSSSINSRYASLAPVTCHPAPATSFRQKAGNHFVGRFCIFRRSRLGKAGNHLIGRF